MYVHFYVTARRNEREHQSFLLYISANHHHHHHYPPINRWYLPKTHFPSRLPAEVCLITPNIWYTNMPDCIINGVELGDYCSVMCNTGYNFSSSMNNVSSFNYDNEEAYVNGYVNLTCLDNRTWSLTEAQTCERKSASGH